MKRGSFPLAALSEPATVEPPRENEREVGDDAQPHRRAADPRIELVAERVVADDVGPGRRRGLQPLLLEVDSVRADVDALERLGDRAVEIVSVLVVCVDDLLLELREGVEAHDAEEVDPLSQIGGVRQVLAPEAVDVSEGDLSLDNPLGAPLGPDSDRAYIDMAVYPIPSLTTLLSFSLERRGEGNDWRQFVAGDDPNPKFPSGVVEKTYGYGLGLEWELRGNSSIGARFIQARVENVAHQQDIDDWLTSVFMHVTWNL